jgi:hypothetical protein
VSRNRRILTTVVAFASFFAAVLTAAGLEGWTLFAHSAACAALLSLALGSPWPALRLGESTPPAR